MLGGGLFEQLKLIGVSLAAQMPYFLVLIAGLYGWLTHSRRGTRGMNLLGLGILAEIGMYLFSPLLSIGLSQLFYGSAPVGASVDPYVIILAQGLLFSLLNSVAIALILWGAFTIARERQEEEADEAAEKR